MNASPDHRLETCGSRARLFEIEILIHSLLLSGLIDKPVTGFFMNTVTGRISLPLAIGKDVS